MRTHGEEAEIRVMQPRAKEQARSHQLVREGRIFLERLLRERGPANTLVLESGDLGLSE